MKERLQIICDKCGCVICEGETYYLDGDTAYCKSCWEDHIEKITEECETQLIDYEDVD